MEDLDEDFLLTVRTGHSLQAKPFPPEILEIIQAGGLMQLVKKKMAAA